MTQTWLPDDFARTQLRSAADVLRWLRVGLADWEVPSAMFRAFEPIADCFDPNDDAEPQLARMFGASSAREQNLLLDTLSLGFATTERGATGYHFFDRLVRLAVLFGRPEPLTPLVDRVASSDLLDGAPEEVARHLFASAVWAVGAAAPGSVGKGLVARLVTSPRYQASYGPYVMERVGARSAESALELTLMLSGAAGGRNAFDDALASALKAVANHVTALDLVEISARGIFDAAPTGFFDEVLLSGFAVQLAALAQASAKVDQLHADLGAPTWIEEAMVRAFADRPATTGRVLVSAVRRAEFRSVAAGVGAIGDGELLSVARTISRRLELTGAGA